MTFATSLKKLHNKTMGQIKDAPPVINPRNEMKADNVCGREGMQVRYDWNASVTVVPCKLVSGSWVKAAKLKAKHRQQLLRM